MSDDNIINFIKLWLASSLIITLLLDARARIKTAYNQFNSEYPPLIRYLTILVFLGGVVALHLAIIGRSDFIILLTLEGVIFYTYYTYRLSEISAKGYTLVEAQKIHTADLKSFLDDWCKHFNKFQINFETEPDTVNKAEIYGNKHKSLEQWRYNDLINHHLPEKHKNLEAKWNQFKRCDYELRSSSYKLYKKIESDINAKMRDNLIEKFENLGSGLDVNDGGLKKLIRKLYELSFSGIDTTSGQHYREHDESSGMNHLMVFDQTRILSSRSMKVVLEAEKQLAEIINPNYLHDRYGRDVKNMRRIDNELSRIRSELIESLDELKGWPLLPGTRCDRLKDFDFNRPK